MIDTVNLREFCRRYKGGMEAILPAEGLAYLLSAVEDGRITHSYAKIILKKFFSLMGGVGIDENGKPFAIFNEEGMEILRKAENRK